MIYPYCINYQSIETSGQYYNTDAQWYMKQMIMYS